MTIESQLDTLIDQSAAQIVLLNKIYGVLSPVVPPPFYRHEPAGYVQNWMPWKGDVLPSINITNQFGMRAAVGQIQTLTILPDHGMRCLFPGRNSALVPSVWPAADFGGRAPSRWMWAADLNRSRKKGLYMCVEFTVGANFTEWGTKGPTFGPRDKNSMNVGLKFIFPRVAGLTSISTLPVPARENDYIRLLNCSDDVKSPLDPNNYKWQTIDPAATPQLAPRWEGITLQFDRQQDVSSNAPHPIYLAPRGQKIKFECTMTLNMSGKGLYTVWLNDSVNPTYTQETIVPLFDKNGIPLTDIFWDYIWSDMTFGGGLNIPWEDQYVDLHSFYSSCGDPS